MKNCRLVSFLGFPFQHERTSLCIIVFELIVEKMVYEGFGLARHQGQVFLIPFAAPGDRVKVKPVIEKRGVVIAQIEEILEPSEHRRTPPCPYYQNCGGCQLQHMDYQSQIKTKEGFVKESLERIGGVKWPHDIIIHYGDEFNYRLRAQLRQRIDDSTVHLGFYKSESHELCEIESCLLLSPSLNAAIQLLRTVSSTQYGQPHETLYLINGDNGEVSSHPETRSLRSDNIEILCRENKYLVGPSDFFQVNRYLLSKMLEVVIDNESGALALDLYCGIGFFSIPLAKCFHHVIAVENNPHSVHLGRLNALKNNSTSIEFFIDSVEKWLFNYKENHKKIDFVLVDPPRVGLSRKIIHGISKLKSKRLTYVSCNPTTLARDLKHLLSIGYDITSIEAVDLFPQTFHIETIVKLVHH